MDQYPDSGDVCILDIAPTIAKLLQVESPEEWLGRPIPFDNSLPKQA